MSFDPEQYRKDLLADVNEVISESIKNPPNIEGPNDRPSYAETYELATQRQRAIYGPKANLDGLGDEAILALATEQTKRNVAAQEQRVSEAQAATPEGIAAIAEQKRQEAAERASLIADVRTAYEFPEDFSDDDVLGMWDTIQATAKEKANDTVEANRIAAEATSKVSD